MHKRFKVITCTAQENYILKITFADGETGLVDLAYLVGKGIFALWNNVNEFKKVSIDPLWLKQFVGGAISILIS